MACKHWNTFYLFDVSEYINLYENQSYKFDQFILVLSNICSYRNFLHSQHRHNPLEIPSLKIMLVLLAYKTETLHNSNYIPSTQNYRGNKTRKKICKNLLRKQIENLRRKSVKLSDDAYDSFKHNRIVIWFRKNNEHDRRQYLHPASVEFWSSSKSTHIALIHRLNMFREGHNRVESSPPGELFALERKRMAKFALFGSMCKFYFRIRALVWVCEIWEIRFGMRFAICGSTISY